jgi:hypothetical protein
MIGSIGDLTHLLASERNRERRSVKRDESGIKCERGDRLIKTARESVRDESG